jgi:putative transposase
MGRKPRIWFEEATYHITNRGNSRQDIFLDPADRIIFLDKLEELGIDDGLKIHAYCLMSNHYHLVIETSDRHIGDTMRTINTFYSKYYHKKYDTSGHLFQDRYRSVLVEKDAYLLEVSRYVHLNPVKAHLVEFPEHYPWSSMKAYLRGEIEEGAVKGTGEDRLTVYRDTILSFFGQDTALARESYQLFVHAKINEAKQNKPDSLENLITYDDILGTNSFVSEIRSRYG